MKRLISEDEMKRLISYGIIIAFILFTECSCEMAAPKNVIQNSAVTVKSIGSENVSGTNTHNGTTSAEKAVILFDKIVELYGIKGQDLFLEHYPQKSDDRAVSYLWPFSGMFSAVNALGKLDGMRNKYDESLALIMNGLEKYYDDLRQPAAYQAYPFEFGGDDRFYDDNMWLGLDFTEAYGLTGDNSYLDKAEDIFNFIKSGWSEELGGGIFWCEQKKETKNTCSNGPAAVLALKLYNITKKTDYLDWGMKIYGWTKQNLQSPEGLYWDNVNMQRVTDKATYAYNSGTMLNAAVLLYRITGDKGYLEEAQRVAKVSYDHFAPANGNGGTRFFPDRNPWFTVILFRGYQALYEIDKNPIYIKAVSDNLDYAWKNARDVNGLISQDWSGKSDNDKENKWLLDEACMVEFYAGIAQWEESNKQVHR